MMHPTAALLALRGFKPFMLTSYEDGEYRIMRGKKEGERMLLIGVAFSYWGRSHVPPLSLYTPTSWDAIGSELDSLGIEDIEWLSDPAHFKA
jgi:hypothetical protein